MPGVHHFLQIRNKVIELDIALYLFDRRKWKVGTDYSGLGKVQYILAEAELPILDSEYGEGVDLTILVPFDQAGAAEKKLIEGTNGRCRIEKLDEVYFGIDDGKIILL